MYKAVNIVQIRNVENKKSVDYKMGETISQ